MSIITNALFTKRVLLCRRYIGSMRNNEKMRLLVRKKRNGHERVIFASRLQMLAALRNVPDSTNIASMKDCIDANLMDLYPEDCLFKVNIAVFHSTSTLYPFLGPIPTFHFLSRTTKKNKGGNAGEAMRGWWPDLTAWHEAGGDIFVSDTSVIYRMGGYPLRQQPGFQRSSPRKIGEVIIQKLLVEHTLNYVVVI